MADIQTTPHIVFARLASDPSGDVSFTSPEAGSLSSLFASVHAEDLTLTYAGPDSAFAAQWKHANFEQPVQVLHLQVEDLTADPKQVVPTISQRLSNIKGLKVVILEAVPDAKWVRHMLPPSAPVMFSMGKGAEGTELVQSFYELILKGHTIRQCYTETKRNTRIGWQWAEIGLDNDKQEISWNELRFGKQLNWERGMWVEAGNRDILNWRLLDPATIQKVRPIAPPTQKQAPNIKPAPDTPADAEPSKPETPQPHVQKPVKQAPPKEAASTPKAVSPVSQTPPVSKPVDPVVDQETPPIIPQKKPKPETQKIPNKEKKPVTSTPVAKATPQPERPKASVPAVDPKLISPKEPSKQVVNKSSKANTNVAPITPKPADNLTPPQQPKKADAKPVIPLPPKKEPIKPSPKATETPLTPPKEAAPLPPKKLSSSMGPPPKPRQKINKPTRKNPLLNDPTETPSANPIRPEPKLQKVEIAPRVRPKKGPKPVDPETKPSKKSGSSRTKSRSSSKQSASSTTSRGRRGGLWIGGIAVLALGGLAAWFFLLGPQRSGASCPFPTEDPAYKVLVLPFHQDIDCGQIDLQYQQAITTQLAQMAQEEGIRISILQDQDACLNTADLQSFIEYCHADLVVGGIWAQTASQLSTLTLQLQTSNQYNEDLFIQRAGLANVIEATQTERLVASMIERTLGLVRWAAGLRATEQKAYSQAADLMGNISFYEESQRTMVNSLWASNMRDAGRYTEAVDSLENWLVHYPEVVAYHRIYADLLARMGHTDQALAAYEIGREATNHALPLQIGQAQLLIDQGKFTAADRLLEGAQQQQGELGVLLLSRGKLAEAQGNTQEAIRLYSQSIAQDERYVDAYLARATLFAANGDMVQARKDIQSVRSMAPDNQDAQLFNARQLVYEQKQGPALEAYNLAINTRPTGQALYERGLLSLDMGQMGEALEDFNQAIRMEPALADPLQERAKLYASTEQWSQALLDAEKLASLRPGDPEVFVMQGNYLTELGKLDEAHIAFDKAIEQNPSYAAAYYSRALLALANEQPLKALNDVNRALQLDPQSPEPLLSRARIYTELGNIDKAQNDYDRAIKLDPQNANSYFFRAELLARQDDPAAMADYQQAISLGGGHLKAYIALGKQATQKRQYTEAMSWFEKAVAFAPGNPEAYVQRGALQAKRNRHEEAAADLAKANELVPQSSVTFLTLRTQVFQALSRYNEALIEINKAIREAPENMMLYCTRGDLYRSMGRENKALEDFNKALELDPGSALPYFYRGELYRQMKAWEEAKTEYAEAIRLDPDFAPAYNRLGEIALQLESFDEAKNHFLEAVKVDPNFAEAYVNLGLVSRRQSNYNQAFEYYNQAIERNPLSEEAYYQRGFIRRAKGDYAGATADLNKALEINPEKSLAYGLLAKIYARQGNSEMVYEFARKALEHRYPLIELQQDPAFSNYQSDPTFQEILSTYE